MKKQNEVIDNLIETLKDGQEGFKQAAESVRNPALKALFSDYSQQRSRFAAALQSEARRQGETEPENSSSATGALHRGWINLKSAITGGDEHAILADWNQLSDLHARTVTVNRNRSRNFKFLFAHQFNLG